MPRLRRESGAGFARVRRNGKHARSGCASDCCAFYLGFVECCDSGNRVWVPTTSRCPSGVPLNDLSVHTIKMFGLCWEGFNLVGLRRSDILAQYPGDTIVDAPVTPEECFPPLPAISCRVRDECPQCPPECCISGQVGPNECQGPQCCELSGTFSFTLHWQRHATAFGAIYAGANCDGFCPDDCPTRSSSALVADDQESMEFFCIFRCVNGAFEPNPDSIRLDWRQSRVRNDLRDSGWVGECFVQHSRSCGPAAGWGTIPYNSTSDSRTYGPQDMDIGALNVGFVQLGLSACHYIGRIPVLNQSAPPPLTLELFSRYPWYTNHVCVQMPPPAPQWPDDHCTACTNTTGLDCPFNTDVACDRQYNGEDQFERVHWEQTNGCTYGSYFRDFQFSQVMPPGGYGIVYHPTIPFLPIAFESSWQNSIRQGTFSESVTWNANASLYRCEPTNCPGGFAGPVNRPRELWRPRDASRAARLVVPSALTRRQWESLRSEFA